jgi:hypothetical protein
VGVLSVWTVADVCQCAGWLADSEQVAVRVVVGAVTEERLYAHYGAASDLV